MIKFFSSIALVLCMTGGLRASVAVTDASCLNELSNVSTPENHFLMSQSSRDMHDNGGKWTEITKRSLAYREDSGIRKFDVVENIELPCRVCVDLELMSTLDVKDDLNDFLRTLGDKQVIDSLRLIDGSSTKFNKLLDTITHLWNNHRLMRVFYSIKNPDGYVAAMRKAVNTMAGNQPEASIVMGHSFAEIISPLVNRNKLQEEEQKEDGGKRLNAFIQEVKQDFYEIESPRYRGLVGGDIFSKIKSPKVFAELSVPDEYPQDTSLGQYFRNVLEGQNNADGEPIRFLKSCGCSITDNDFKALCPSIQKMESVMIIDLASNPLTKRSFKKITTLLEKESVKFIDLSNSDFSAVSFYKFLCEQNKSLLFDKAIFEDDDMQNLGKEKKLKTQKNHKFYNNILDYVRFLRSL